VFLVRNLLMSGFDFPIRRIGGNRKSGLKKAKADVALSWNEMGKESEGWGSRGLFYAGERLGQPATLKDPTAQPQKAKPQPISGFRQHDGRGRTGQMGLPWMRFLKSKVDSG